jgi:hypothetical protein
MKKNLAALLLPAVLAGWMHPAAAQPIYRCGDSYSQKPCPGGRVVEADDARSASQKSQTDQAARRDAQAAEAMEKARLKEEARPAPLVMPPAKPAEPVKPVAASAAKKPATFTAVAPKKPGDASGKKKKKAKKKEA